MARSCGATIDTNGSGVVEQAEYLSFSGFAFDDWDENGDRALTPAEFHTCWRAMAWGDASRAFAIFDEDQDQRIDPKSSSSGSILHVGTLTEMQQSLKKRDSEVRLVGENLVRKPRSAESGV